MTQPTRNTTHVLFDMYATDTFNHQSNKQSISQTGNKKG